MKVKEKSETNYINPWVTTFSFKKKCYKSLRVYNRIPIISKTIKLVNNKHDRLSWKMLYLSFMDEKGVENIVTFSKHSDEKLKDYSVIGWFEDLTEKQCQEIAEVSPHTDFLSYIGTGKKVFKTAKSALRSFQLNDSIIVRDNRYENHQAFKDKKLDTVAKFMGGKNYYYMTGGSMRRKESNVYEQWVFPDNPRRREILSWTYDSSWNWLMPVYHKIKKDFGKKLYPPKDIEKAFEKAYDFIKDNS